MVSSGVRSTDIGFARTLGLVAVLWFAFVAVLEAQLTEADYYVCSTNNNVFGDIQACGDGPDGCCGAGGFGPNSAYGFYNYGAGQIRFYCETPTGTQFGPRSCTLGQCPEGEGWSGVGQTCIPVQDCSSASGQKGFGGASGSSIPAEICSGGCGYVPEANFQMTFGDGSWYVTATGTTNACAPGAPDMVGIASNTTQGENEPQETTTTTTAPTTEPNVPGPGDVTTSTTSTTNIENPGEKSVVSTNTEITASQAPDSDIVKTTVTETTIFSDGSQQITSTTTTNSTTGPSWTNTIPIDG